MPMTAPQKRRAEGAKSSRLRKAERKRHLLAHAKRLFVEIGYQATTTAQIAEAAAVSDSDLHQLFDSKKALFLAVLAEIRAATLERWQNETDGNTDPLAKLHAIAEMYLSATHEQALE